jgi:AraC-like DNA-binding protein
MDAHERFVWPGPRGLDFLADEVTDPTGRVQADRPHRCRDSGQWITSVGSIVERRMASTTPVHPVRHLLRAKDLVDARYREPLDVATLARAAHLSRAHFSREFREAFGEPPHQYLLTRRLERAAALLRNTDRSVADICLLVGLHSVGSFTTSFGRTYGMTPTAYRADHAPAIARARVPTCVLQAYARQPSSTFGEDTRGQAS